MTLVIVDMQPYFDSCDDEVVDEAVKEIRRAKEQRTGVVVVEFGGCGPTDSSIQKVLRGYDRQAWVTKDDDDGGRAVVNAAHQHGFWNKSWRFCGVNTCCCVRDTIKSMVRIYPKAVFEYAVEAMNCTCDKPWKCAQYFEFQAG